MVNEKTRVWDRERLMMFDLLSVDEESGVVKYLEKENVVEKDSEKITIIKHLGIKDDDSLDIYDGDILILEGSVISYINKFVGSRQDNFNKELRVVAEDSEGFYKLISMADKVTLIGDAFHNPMLARNIWYNASLSVPWERPNASS